MRVISPSFEIFSFTPDLEALIERAGRVCYKSEDKITPTSSSAFIARLKESKHASVLEHGAITVKIVCDRGVSHELVRHRVASFSQESTRYCGYHKGKFGGELTVVRPVFWAEGSAEYFLWLRACEEAERSYLALIGAGAAPQEARSVLPTSLKTEVIITANPREWLHIFSLRTSSAAHPQMREIMCPLQATFTAKWPAIFSTCSL